MQEIGVILELKYKTKQPLNMFMLVFRNDENVNKIYEYKVEILPLRKTKLVPQCKRCQFYGYTQGYCWKEPRCVRFKEKHSTAKCDKPKKAKPKCFHCGKDLPANYRGCIVVKEIQSIKNKQNQKKYT